MVLSDTIRFRHGSKRAVTFSEVLLTLILSARKPVALGPLKLSRCVGCHRDLVSVYGYRCAVARRSVNGSLRRMHNMQRRVGWLAMRRWWKVMGSGAMSNLNSFAMWPTLHRARRRPVMSSHWPGHRDNLISTPLRRSNAAAAEARRTPGENLDDNTSCCVVLAESRILSSDTSDTHLRPRSSSIARRLHDAHEAVGSSGKESMRPRTVDSANGGASSTP